MLPLLTLLAVAWPLVWAWQRPPQPAFFSQALACGLWSLVVLVAALHPDNTGLRWSLRRAAPLLLWALLLATAVAQVLVGKAPAFLAAPIALNLLLAGLLSWTVLAHLGKHAIARAWDWLLAGVLIAALLNALAALVQAVAPAWINDSLIAALAGPNERAGGNLRQPNQLATLMVWGVVAATSLLRHRLLLWLASCAALIAALLASGSRAGILSLLLVAAIAAIVWLRSPSARRGNGRTRQPRPTWRPWLMLALAVALLALLGWAAQHAFSRDTADASLAQRLALWRQTVELIAQYPWTGVGWTQLNFAWTLTPFAGRAPDVFDHAHSLPLHLAVELGLPVAALALALVAIAVWPRWPASPAPAGRQSERLLVASLLLLSIALHSLFEYPLWFSYFLLPAAVVLAVLVRDLCATEQATPAIAIGATVTASRQWAAAAAALLSLVATGWGVGEYRKASAIHFSGGDRVIRNAAVAAARASPLYGHYGDYAAIMLAGDDAPLDWFARPVRNVLDERLLTAWARALARTGQHERAAWVVARAREFPPDAAFAGLPQVTAPAPPASTPRGPADFR